MFVNIIAMDGYMFNESRLDIFPFDNKLYQSGPWYEGQLDMFLDGLEDMKRNYEKSV